MLKLRGGGYSPCGSKDLVQNSPFTFSTLTHILFSFFAGMASEHIGIVSILALGSLFIYLHYFKKIPIPFGLTLAFLFFVLGYAALYFSPGHAARASLKVFEGFYKTLPQLWELSLYEKIKRIFITMRAFNSRAYFIFTALVFIFAFWKICPFHTLKKRTLAFIVGAFIVYSARKGNLVVAQYFITFICLSGLTLKERRFVWIFILNLFYLLCMAATLQFPGLPSRARLGDTMLSVAMILLLLRPVLSEWRFERQLRVALLVLLCLYGAWVMGAYAQFRVDWNKMVATIREEKSRGNLDIVVDGKMFTSRYRNFSDWGSIGTNPDEWPNTTYAKMFGVKTIRTQ